MSFSARDLAALGKWSLGPDFFTYEEKAAVAFGEELLYLLLWKLQLVSQAISEIWEGCVRSSWGYHVNGIYVDQNNRDLPTAYRVVLGSHGLHGFIRAGGQSPTAKYGSINLQLPHRAATAFVCLTQVWEISLWIRNLGYWPQKCSRLCRAPEAGEAWGSGFFSPVARVTAIQVPCPICRLWEPQVPSRICHVCLL